MMKSKTPSIVVFKNRSWRIGFVLLLLLVMGSMVGTAVPIAAHHVPTTTYWNAPGGTLPPGVQHYTFQSNYLLPGNNTVGLNVYTPPGYEDPGNTQEYPVIYYMHGINGNERNYFTWFDDIYNQPSILSYIEGTVPPPPGITIPQAIAVFINGGKQSYYNDYSDEYHGPDSPFPILSESILINEVIPFVDNQFRTIASREGRGLEGLSMGARGALKLALKHPDLICSAIAYGGANYDEGQPGTFYEGPFLLEDRLSYIIETNAPQVLQYNTQIRVAVGEFDYGQQASNATLHGWLNAAGIPHEYDPAVPNTVHNLTQYYANTGAYGLSFHGQCFQSAVSTPTPTPAGNTPTPTAIPTATHTPTVTSTPSPTHTPTQTPTPSTTPVSTATPTATATPNNPQNTGWQPPTAESAGSGGDGNGFEVNPTAAFSDDGVFAQDVNSGNGSSTSCASTQKDSHLFSDFGLTIPGEVAIAGIEVRLNAQVDATIGSPKMCVQLSWDGGGTWTAPRSVQFRNTNENTYTLGSATFLWGRVWEANDFTNTNFRVRVINVSSDTLRDFSLDWMAVRVHYQ